MKTILRWILTSLAIMLIAYFLPGVVINGLWSAMWVVVFLAIVNVLIKPLLILITLPINILTLGLFTFVINALLIMLASSVIKGFSVSGFITALLFSLLLSIASYAINLIIKK